MATVFIFSALLCMTAAALLRYSSAEFRLNQRNQLRFQAKNAAEAMLEYGASELMARLQLKQNFTSSELVSNKIKTAAARKGTLFATGTGTYNNVDPASLQLWASQYSDATRKIVDPSDPGNRYDPLRGQKIRALTVRMLASATSTASSISATQYATQSIEIRDVYLFNYAIFYNIRMEFHPGADMVISGPVHSNEDTYLSTDTSLKFLSPVTTAGLFYANGFASGRSSNHGNVYFTNGLDSNSDTINDTIGINDSGIKDSTGVTALGTYVDSTLATRDGASNTFSAIASQTWKGNVQDSTMGVIAQTPPAIPAGVSAQAHKMIEPPDTSSSADVNLEAQKFSRKAGLYILQEANSGNAPPAPVAFTNAVDAAEYKAAPSRTTWLSNNKSKVVQLPSGLITNTRRLTDFRENKTVSTVDINLGVLRTSINSATTGAATNLKQWDSTSSTYADLNLDTSVTRNDAADVNWNGQVYVEIEDPNSGFKATSDVGAMGEGTGSRTSVRIVNGSSVPNRKDATGSASSADGFTLATNAPVYITGDLNSPGIDQGQRLNSSGVATNVGTETDATIGSPKLGESPVSIAGDAINILSNAWWNSTTKKPVGDETSSNSTRPQATKTEIAAAFLTGNVESASNGEYSGGVENFPRFLETWGSATKIRYRGSMVALYNSTIATGRWSSAKYSAPGRQWGFSSMFRDGRQPPGTPMLRTFRRVTYGDISAGQFNSLLTSTSPDFKFVAQ